MDSLSQIVLGAAVGEAVLGKKIGNKAMVWGAIAGTIPDLDVLSNLWLSEIDGLIAHRGFSHSITFSILGGLFFGWLINHIYTPNQSKRNLLLLRLLTITTVVILCIWGAVKNHTLIPTMFTLPVLALGGMFTYRRYQNPQKDFVQTTVRDWQWLFFLGLITHPILDCFTVYGTQILLPFTNKRIAWSTISVVDPIYTIPFLICLIIASRYAAGNTKRTLWNYIGLGLSCGYLLFTVGNKLRVNSIMQASLDKLGVTTEKTLVAPTIFNNILWHGVARKDDEIYAGKYSLNDTEKTFKLRKFDVGDKYIDQYKETKTIKTLKWFSDDYYTVFPLDSNTLQYNDMRYGKFFDDLNRRDDYIFSFNINTDTIPLGLHQDMSNASQEDGSELLKHFYERLKGI